MNSRTSTCDCQYPPTKLRHALLEASLCVWTGGSSTDAISVSLSISLHKYVQLRSRRVWRAIISSSLVGMDHAETRASGELMRAFPALFAIELSSTPSQAASRHTRSR